MEEVETNIAKLFELNYEQQDTKDKLHYDKEKNAIITKLKFTQCKSISFDILGDMSLQDQTDSPKYYYQVTEEQLILNIELYGKFEPQNNDKEERHKKLICSCEKSGCSILEWHGSGSEGQLIKLRAQYLGPISSILQKPDKINERLGRFQLIVPVPQNKCVLKVSRPIFSFQEGIARFEFQIQKKTTKQQ